MFKKRFIFTRFFIVFLCIYSVAKAQERLITEFYCTDVVAASFSCKVPSEISIEKYSLVRQAFTEIFYSDSAFEFSNLKKLKPSPFIFLPAHQALKSGVKPFSITFSSFEAYISSDYSDYRLPNTTFLFNKTPLPPCYTLNRFGKYELGTLKKITPTEDLITLENTVLFELSKNLIPRCKKHDQNLNLLINTLDNLYSTYENICQKAGGKFTSLSNNKNISNKYGAHESVAPDDRPFYLGIMAKWIDPQYENYRCVLGPRA
ncbi:hypothetical protein MRY82_01415 [bacterium]|nr:hypothetical protein [bacterium]